MSKEINYFIGYCFTFFCWDWKIDTQANFHGNGIVDILSGLTLNEIFPRYVLPSAFDDIKKDKFILRNFESCRFLEMI